MQEINFYCRKCKKSLKMSYTPCGDDAVPAMNGIMIRCRTNKCTRVVIFRNFTEGNIISSAEADGKCYL